MAVVVAGCEAHGSDVKMGRPGVYYAVTTTIVHESSNGEIVSRATARGLFLGGSEWGMVDEVEPCRCNLVAQAWDGQCFLAAGDIESLK